MRDFFNDVKEKNENAFKMNDDRFIVCSKHKKNKLKPEVVQFKCK